MISSLTHIISEIQWKENTISLSVPNVINEDYLKINRKLK